MEQSELNEVLRLHKLWLAGRPEGERAYLTGANLYRTNLAGVLLRDAYLANADLSGANLFGADLRFSYLTNADLTDANLTGAGLLSANLTGADLFGADLTRADLRFANLRSADLSGADLSGADLAVADLRYANLTDADLSGADLTGAILNWHSHDLLAEILRQEAGSDIEKIAVSDLILQSRDLCWKQFKALNHKLQPWVFEVFRKTKCY